jgi:hypothetical protein
MKRKKRLEGMINDARTAGEICLMLWDHIAMYGCNKEGAMRDLGLPSMINDCPLCEFVMSNFESPLDCSECPIAWPWTKDWQGECPTILGKFACNNSYYGEWQLANRQNSKRAKRLANKIVNLMLDFLNKNFPEETTK